VQVEVVAQKWIIFLGRFFSMVIIRLANGITILAGGAGAIIRF
jgi:hypothetical protein